MKPGTELVFAALRAGELSASEAWKLLAPLAKTEDHSLVDKLADALRAWVWKALDRRRRDSGLREWIDVLNKLEGFFADRFVLSAAKIELMAELLHESLAVAELAAAEDVERRKHVPDILRWLALREGDWAGRGALMSELGLKPANTTRLVSLLVDLGWVEQRLVGREVTYRLSSEGVLQAHKIALSAPAITEPELPAVKSCRYTHAWVTTLIDQDHRTRWPHRRDLGNEAAFWDYDAAEISIVLDDGWLDDDEDETAEGVLPSAPPILLSVGGSC